MQEMHARLCGLHVEEVQGGRFKDFARRDADGRPANMPGQNEPSTYIDHMDFLLYSTQQEADRARTRANLEHIALVEARSTIRILAKERKSLRRQRDEKEQDLEELKANVAELTAYIESLEDHLGEEEGIDLRTEENALISDEDDFMEDLDDPEDGGHNGFIVSDEEEDPEEPAI
jgi:cell division protein FtsB